MYRATTRAIQVTVQPQYLPDQSEPEKSQFVWAYTVRIENRGDVVVQLRSRHWKITDGLGRLQEVCRTERDAIGCLLSDILSRPAETGESPDSALGGSPRFAMASHGRRSTGRGRAGDALVAGSDRRADGFLEELSARFGSARRGDGVHDCAVEHHGDGRGVRGAGRVCLRDQQHVVAVVGSAGDCRVGAGRGDVVRSALRCCLSSDGA